MPGKCVHTIAINNWFPEMCTITFPLIKAWADKIGAHFKPIIQPMFPDFPPNYEKFQIWETGKNYDWNIYIDADMIIDPKQMPDFTQQDPRYLYYESKIREPSAVYNAHAYFIRDGRNFGISDCFFMASSMLHDLWQPLDMTFQQAVRYCKRGQRTVSEFAINLNIARYGLKGYGTIGPDKNHFHLQTTDDFHRPMCGGKTNMTNQEHITRANKIIQTMGLQTNI